MYLITGLKGRKCADVSWNLLPIVKAFAWTDLSLSVESLQILWFKTSDEIRNTAAIEKTSAFLLLLRYNEQRLNPANKKNIIDKIK